MVHAEKVAAIEVVSEGEVRALPGAKFFDVQRQAVIHYMETGRTVLLDRGSPGKLTITPLAIFNAIIPPLPT